MNPNNRRSLLHLDLLNAIERARQEERAQRMIDTYCVPSRNPSPSPWWKALLPKASGARIVRSVLQLVQALIIGFIGGCTILGIFQFFTVMGMVISGR